MTAIKGVWGAVDNTGAAWHNDIEDYRALAWEVFNRTQGVIRGFGMTLDVGSLSVTFAPGAAMVEQRGTDITGDARGYFVYNDVATVVPFGTPSAASRNDAVVFCWGDPQYGSLGASVPAPGGPQIVVVAGVSGSTTPRTDAQIQTAIGVGGWFRYADVIIAPGNTSVQAGNVTLATTDAIGYVGWTKTVYTTANINTPLNAVWGDVTGFNFPAVPGAYAIDCVLFTENPSSSSVDIRFGWSWTGTGAMTSGMTGLDINVASPAYNGSYTAHSIINDTVSTLDESTGLGTPAAIPAVARVAATYVCTVAGTVQLRHRQDQTDASFASRLDHGSRMRVERIA